MSAFGHHEETERIISVLQDTCHKQAEQISELNRLCEFNEKTASELIKQRDELLADRDTWKTRAEFSYQERSKLENQVEGLINQLSKHQIEAKIGSAVNRACRELPLGYDLHIELEKDAGTVSLYRPDGEKVDEEFHDCDYFSGSIENAINVAIALAEKGGAA